MFTVTYVDDARRTHICFVSHWSEIKFLIERFGKESVQFEPAAAF